MVRPLEDAPFVNVFDDAFRADPQPIIDELRHSGWLARTPIGCLVIGREQVHSLLSDPRLHSALMPLVQIQGVAGGRIAELVSAAVLAMDGPDHARVRRLVSRAFTPRAVEPYRPAMRALVEELVAPLAGRGRCEFMSAFADHYPVQVICHLMGVPTRDHERFARWGDALTYVLSLELGPHIAEVSEALEGLNAYLDQLIADRQRAPRDDLVSELVMASEDGDRLNPTELRALLGGLLFAGYDTTRNQLGLAIVLFCEHPDQWRLLAKEPELAAPAVEEVMRVSGAVAGTPRITTEDVELDGWRIPAGTIVFLSLTSANHDPSSYVDPHRFDITATREPQLTFGGGPHYCLGANLARAEMQEALPVLAKTMPNVALAAEPEWRQATGIFGPTRLELVFG